MQQLGTMKKIKDLRTIWPHEAYDFTKWVAKEKNLALLSDAIGIDIELEETESPVGGFNVDIYAKEQGTNRRIIIENQLEETNHDHLGKIITYASGKDAEVVIWIVKKARDEHKLAVEWLNQHTDENIGFFLIEIELWQIDDSNPAPKFNVVESPNEWAKTVKAAEGLTETQALQLKYWQAFVEFARNDDEYNKHFPVYKPQPQNWYAIWLKGYNSSHLNLTALAQKKQICAVIYINDNKDLFNIYKQNESDIEAITGCKAKYNEASKDCRIVIERKGDMADTDKWEEFFRWQIDTAIKLKSVIKKYEK